MEGADGCNCGNETTSLDELSTSARRARSTTAAFWPAVHRRSECALPKEDIWITELWRTSGGKPTRRWDARAESPRIDSDSPVNSASTSVRRAPTEGPLIDGIFVRGLYLFNPKQQEVVVDYFRNLVRSPYFAIDPNNQAKVIKPTTPNNTEWAFPYELRLDLRNP